jgi:glycosyltransferase involved in cell wall biosynthesis
MAAITNADAVLQLAGWYRPHVGGLFRASYHDGNLAVYLERPDLAIPRQAARVGRGFAWERRLYDSIDVIFTMSEWLRASFISDFGQSPDKVVAVGAGANFSALPAPAERDWTTPRFLFVGRDWERKGGPNLLRAWPALRRARPDATLRIVGPTAIPEALPAGVEFVGRLDPSTPEGQAAFDTAYREATAFVMPSLFEPFGIVFLEAMAHGLPCVAADRCAMPEIVHDHVTGRIAAPEDPGALAEALISVADPHTACRMGVAGRERMREQFTWEAVADRILAEIEARLPVAQVGRRQGARDRGLRR